MKISVIKQVLLICILLATNHSPVLAKNFDDINQVKIEVRVDQPSEHPWRATEIMPIYWKINNIGDKDLLRSVKTVIIGNQAGTHAYPLNAGEFTLERSGTVYWNIPKDIETGNYYIIFDLIFLNQPSPNTYQGYSDYLYIEN